MDPFLVLQQLMQICAEAQTEAELKQLIENLGLEEPDVSDDTADDGRPIRRAQTAFVRDVNDPDLDIPVATWKLRLVPTPVGGSNAVRVPITLICNRDDNSFRELRIELARFELEADRNDLIAADLKTDPHTHLVPTKGRDGGRVPVRLLGPGLTLILTGTSINDFDFEFTAAEGASEPDFPLARFEPPHFIIAQGGEPTDIGVVCDEVLVDLKRDDDPAVVEEAFPELAGSFRGFFLKELGIFIGDGEELGTWSGMAAMRDFFIELNPGKLTGTFIGELVHFVVDEPQVPVFIFFQDNDGDEVLAADEGDASVGAPTGGREFVRVRLEAKPTWDSAGFRSQWTVPPGVTVEEPNRLTGLNLGWVQVPPGDHAFTVQVSDHRIVPDFVETRRVIVAEPSLPDDDPEKPPFTVVFDGILEDAGFQEGERPTNRLHMTMRPGQQATITARVFGEPEELSAQLKEEPADFFNLVSSAPSGSPPNTLQALEHLPDSKKYELAQWVVRAPDENELAGFGGPHAVLLVDVKGIVEENGVEVVKTVTRRLRITVEDGPPENHVDFELASYTDWRADVGIGLARIELLNGLDFGTIEWALESEEIDEGLFSDPAKDELFEGGSFTVGQSVSLPNSAGTVRPFLDTDNRLWRLSGRVPSNGAIGSPPTPAPVVVGEGYGEDYVPGDDLSTGVLNHPDVASFVGTDLRVVGFVPSDGAGVRTILFHYDCDQIQPAEGAACVKLGEEHAVGRTCEKLLHNETNREQARGFAALFRAVAEFGDQIDEIGLFGTASVEGNADYNKDLSRRRVEAVHAAIVKRPLDVDLVEEMNSDELPAADRFTVPVEVLDRVTDLENAGKISDNFIGADRSKFIDCIAPDTGTAPDPEERRVFAILKLKTAVSDQEIVRREYFVTLPGAPPPAETPRTKTNKLHEHPFRHAIFRLARVEVELLRNELIRLLVLLKLDLEAFNENDVLPGGDLNELDGLTDFFFEFRENPSPLPDEPRYSWEAGALSDPRDVDGFAVLKAEDHPTLVGVLGPPAVVLPPVTALSGGRTNMTGFAVSAAVGAVLASLGVLDVRRFISQGFRARVLHGNTPETGIAFAFDYTIAYHIDADLSQMGIPGLPNLTTHPDQPIEVTFRNVGVEYRRGSQSVEFFYDPDSGFQLKIDDPGVFRLGDGIGRLLNVESFRAGAGSPLWFEVELSLALETGIFSIDTLRIRVSVDMDQLFEAQDGVVTLDENSLSLEDFSISLNKLGVSVNVPGTLAGRGELGISGDTVEGEVAVALVPLDLQIYGAVKVRTGDDFNALFAALGVDFAPGILLGTTGAAIYGFHGLIGVNMTRSREEPLPWFKEPTPGVTDPNAKWDIARGNWAFGVGTVVGTAYDDGFSFSTKGAFILEIPGPKFLLATVSKFLADKPAVGDAAMGNLISVIMLDFENDLLLIGIDFTYQEPNLLEFRVPTEIFFNLADSDDWHIRFGQWEPVSKRITLRLLNFFDAWGYYVLEGDGSKINGPLDLAGVSLATGARIELFWGSKTIGLYLEAYVEYHVGLQIKPIYLEGLLQVGGELHLVVASIGASGKLNVKAPDPFVIRGEVCGELGVWRFKVTKCADFSIGDGDAKTPEPENPFNKTVVIDRLTSAAVDDPDQAPLDAVLHLIFDMDMIDARPEAEQAINLSDLGEPRNQVSTDLYYEFHLEDARLVRTTDDAAVDIVQSAWGPYSLPLPDDAGPDAAAKADATRTLRLLDWVPNSHPRALDFRRGYGRTVRLQVERLCDPTPPPDRDCATFDEEALGVASLWFLNQEELAPVVVISSQADGLGAEFLGDLADFTWARVVPLVPVTYPDSAPQKRCLRLPSSARQEDRRSLEEIVPGLPDLIISGAGLGAGQIWLAGLLFIRLPDLVAADITFVVPAELPIDGEAVFLDAFFEPLGPITSIQAADFVPGSSGGGAFSAHFARRLRFGPPEDTDEDPPRAAWLVINPPGRIKIFGADPYSYLNEICGVTFEEWRQWQEREKNKQRTIGSFEDLAGILGGESADPGQELLDPNTGYRLEGSVRWFRYRSASSPDDDGSGTFPISTSFRTSAASPEDISRYVLNHDPPGGDQPHYYQEVVKIAFASDVIDRLFAKFGSQLVARAHSDTGGHVLNQPLVEPENEDEAGGLRRDFFPFGSYEETLFDALSELDGACRPKDFEFLFPRPVATFAEPLAPNTGYTVTLIPRPLGEPEGLSEEEWNRLLQQDFDDGNFVFRFDMRTSRWATFSDHVAHYRAAAVGDIIADDATVIDDALAEITQERGDEAIDALNTALFGGPLAIPGTPEVVRIWVPTGPAPDAFSPPPVRCRAILLDGPEPMLKRRPDGGQRVTIDARQSDNAEDAFEAAAALDGLRVIAGARGARILLFFDPATPPPVVQIELHDQPGGDKAETREHLVIPVGDTPGSFDEEGS